MVTTTLELARTGYRPQVVAPDDDRFVGLAAELGQEFAARAAEHDRDNTFPVENFDRMRERGYLRLAVPEELGGLGATMRQVCYAQAELAKHCASTALAVNMHLYLVLANAYRWRKGAAAAEGVLRRVASDGIVLMTSGGSDGIWPSATAIRDNGGYRVTGRKLFCSQAPVADVLVTMAAYDDPAEGTVVLLAGIPTSSPGVRTVETWDTLGMRPTQSHDTVLDGVFVPDARIGRVVPAGDGSDLFLVGMAMWPLSLMAAVYLGIADRALELGVQSATTRTSIAIERGTMAHNPEVQHATAGMFVDLLTAATLLEATADACAVDPEAPDLPLRIMAAKQVATDAAKRVVDRAQEVVGGSAIAVGTELERLFRDVRCGWFNGMNGFLTAETIGKAVLGVEPRPRW